jgi:molybdenum cofactor synthesis domain-containing protein
MSEPAGLTVAILTISDSAAAGTRADRSGPAVAERCRQYNWLVQASAVVPDDHAAIAGQLAKWADEGVASVLLTTGGTGVASRDVTPEATRSILEREIPGLGELIRLRGVEQNRFAVLSRGVAGTRKQSLIVNFPGSPKGAVYSLETISHLVPHAVQLLAGKTEHAPPAAGSGN